LIAEEVAKVYPELVIRNEAGQAEGVRYEELTPMLLNEVQKQAAEIRDLRQRQKQSNAQGAQLRDMQQQLAELQEFRRSMQGRAANQ
jgi:Tfp pilus assembly protein PilO